MQSGDHASARDALIRAWRTHRSGALADLVDIVAAKAPDIITAQLAIAITPRVASSMTNVRALRMLDDPRVSKWATDQLVALPFTTPAAKSLLYELVRVVEEHRDSRLALRQNEIDRAVWTRIGRLAIRVSLRDRVAKAVKAIPQVDELDVSEIARLVEPMRRTAKTADSLLADIYANPDDDAPRIVYADLLAEQGDPRGEFITLQLGAERSPREAELLKKHGKAWLGRLAPALSWGRGYSGTEFRRGFVATADIIQSVGKKLDPIRRDPAWATVEKLDGSWSSDLLVDAPMTALKEIDRPVDAMLTRLASRTVSLGVTIVRINQVTACPAELLCSAFPRLDRVKIWAVSMREMPLEAVGTLGVRCVEITHNWYGDGDDLERGIRAFDETIAKLVGVRAFVDELVLVRPRTSNASDRTVVLVRRDGNFAIADG